MVTTQSLSAPVGRSPELLRIIQHVLYCAMVLLGTTRAVLDGSVFPAAALAGAALLGWYIGGQCVAGWRDRRSRQLWLAGLSVLSIAAVWVSADFAWVSFAVFVTYANAMAPPPAVAAILALAVGTGGVLVVRWPSDGHWAAQVVGPLVGATVAAALVGVSRVAGAEAAERQRLIDELLVARDDLALAHLDAGARAERERLSREIHDTLAQGFTSVVLAARRSLHASEIGDDKTIRRELGHLEALGREGVEHARRLVRQLPPAELDDRSLPTALQLLARSGRGIGDPFLEVRVDGEPRTLAPEVDLALLRVAQEAVTNARRHAQAALVVVTLTYQPATVGIDVADDGTGFDPSSRNLRGFGLSSMQSRVHQLGGCFTIESAPGQGTTINATIQAPASREKSAE